MIFDILTEEQRMENINRVLEIFGAFVYREYGFPNSEIRKEFTLIASCGDLDAYLRAKRTGRKIPLNRKLRRELYSFFEDARNAACFEREMLEA